MSFLSDLFTGIDFIAQEELQDRLDIVAHKIKFMDKMPVVLLNLDNNPGYYLSEEIMLAGGIMASDVFNAVYIIYYQQGKTLTDLMREVPSILNPDWQAVNNNRVILLNDDINGERPAANTVSLIEDLAEMLHPGTFIFGYEGDKWIRFGT